MNTKIERLYIARKVDEYPDFSHLGDFSNKPGQFAIPHDGGPHAFKFFNAQNVENQEQARENYERVASYERGNWYYMGVYAEAEVFVAGVRQTFTSGGLWGVESDSPEDYLQEIENEQIAELEDVLKELGIQVPAEMVRAALGGESSIQDRLNNGETVII